MRPRRGRIGVWLSYEICWISHVLRVEASQAMLRMRPTSPMRL